VTTQSPILSNLTSLHRLHRLVAGGAAVLAAAVGLILAAPGQSNAVTPNPALTGHLDSVTALPGQVKLSGWAADTATPRVPINVSYSVGSGAGAHTGAARAHDLRTDVGQAFPNLGNYHGFTVTVYVSPGTYPVCAWALDPTGGPSRPIGCQTARVPVDRSARGHLDVVRSIGANHIQVAGWAVDDDTVTTPVSVGIYLGGTAGHAYSAVSATANQSRPDVAAVFPAIGPNHGFSATIAARPGTFPVCVYANDSYIFGAATLLGCLNVTV